MTKTTFIEGLKNEFLAMNNNGDGSKSYFNLENLVGTLAHAALGFGGGLLCRRIWPKKNANSVNTADELDAVGIVE